MISIIQPISSPGSTWGIVGTVFHLGDSPTSAVSSSYASGSLDFCEKSSAVPFSHSDVPMRFSAGYPVVTYLTKTEMSTQGGFNLGGINATGQVQSTLFLSLQFRDHRLEQVPSISGNWGLIDLDTPQSAHTMPSWFDPSSELQLVFSDEFNTDGRSFYPGDDPYWEAVDLYYWVRFPPDAHRLNSVTDYLRRPRMTWSIMIPQR
jgi:hypothetical protein